MWEWRNGRLSGLTLFLPSRKPGHNFSTKVEGNGELEDGEDLFVRPRSVGGGQLIDMRPGLNLFLPQRNLLIQEEAGKQEAEKLNRNFGGLKGLEGGGQK